MLYCVVVLAWVLVVLQYIRVTVVSTWYVYNNTECACAETDDLACELLRTRDYLEWASAPLGF